MTTQLPAVVELENTLQTINFKAALPSHISKEKFIRTVLTAVKKDPSHSSQDLMAANRNTLYQAAMFCAEDGLLPNGKEAAFVVKGGKVVYMPMIAGILKKMRNSGNLKWVDAVIVCENDEFEAYTDETGHHFRHVPNYKERGKPYLTYAAAITMDGGTYFEPVTTEQMNAIEKMSQTDKIWKGPFRDEMKRKSALRRLAKRMPSSSDIETMLHRDDEVFYDDEEPEKKETPKASSRMDAIVNNVQEPEVEPEPQPPAPEPFVVEVEPEPQSDPDDIPI